MKGKKSQRHIFIPIGNGPLGRRMVMNSTIVKRSLASRSRNNDGNSIVADLKAVDVRPYIPIAPSWNLTIPAFSPT